MLSFGARGEEEGQFDTPLGIAIVEVKSLPYPYNDLEGEVSVWVADGKNKHLQAFTDKGKSWYLESTPPGAFPISLVKGPDGNIYVGMMGLLSSIDVFKPVTRFSGFRLRIPCLAPMPNGKQVAEGCPGAIAFGKKGEMYVLDPMNFRVMVFEKRTVPKQGWIKRFPVFRFHLPLPIMMSASESLWRLPTGIP